MQKKPPIFVVQIFGQSVLSLHDGNVLKIIRNKKMKPAATWSHNPRVWDVLRLGSFYSWDILYLERFGVRTFLGLGRFVFGTFYIWNVL
jgi:hypothetical protein